MQVVVPAAGQGTRLRPLTADRPKGLVEIGGKPLLEHVFETAIEAGAAELVVVIGKGGIDIQSRFGECFGSVPVTYVHQPEPRGLGDAVLRTRPVIDGTFTVLNGDNVFGGSIEAAIERSSDPKVDGVLLVESAPPKIAKETGVVTISGDTIKNIVEKPDSPPSQLVTTGCYVLPRAVFHALELLTPSERGELELSEAVGLLIDAGYTVSAVRYHGDRVNVNRPRDVDEAERVYRK